MTTDKVVDASALAAMVFLESRAPDMANRLQGGTLFAPALLDYEMAHICLKKMRAQPSLRPLILSQYLGSQQLGITLVGVDPPQVVDLAEQHKLSAYDASYLWLALSLGIDLVTGDTDLEKAFTAARP